MAEKRAELLELLSEGPLNERMFNASFGLRLEEHRILTNGRASRYEYPKNLSSRKTNPYLASGFSDNMMEFITPITRGSKATCQQLRVLEQIVDSQMHEDERIWPLSLAPAPEYQHDLEFVGNNCSQPWNKEYTNYLREKYGIKRMMLGGAHIGFNLDQELLDTLYEQIFKDDFASQAAFQNTVYFKMAQCFCLWRWLFTYLYGASPVSEAVEHDMPEHIQLPVRSFRNSTYGYNNLPAERPSYVSLDGFVDQISKYLEDGTYYGPQEFFGPVRLHGKHDDDSLRQIVKDGIQFISFRSFDLDPFAKGGISEDTLNFLELFMLYTLVSPMPENLSEKMQQAIERNNEVALQAPNEQTDWMREEAMNLIEKLGEFCEQFHAPREYKLALSFVKRRVEDPTLTIGGQVAEKLAKGDLLSFGLKIANDRYTSFVRSTHPLQALASQYSDSVQKLIKIAIMNGVHVEFGDPLKLRVGEQIETFEAQADLDLSRGAQDYLLNMFPELEGTTNE
ncbi:glutamate--cysteine ligase [Limosilactobacillus mucosae]|uniref:Glutamate--cysteine ligase n=1 Tax=Limosilactobacillus mucosae TaxID=97478 RepID=A0AAJ1HWJ1_LIMMU|nr:glutamate--cysteine ligase [Limosilactobacillus mucosae]MDC2830706.1 glutamate--cysteine ligase [Limosilactobacillus mucosae]MDC2836488.1 glutamate--cysteine ligase [Limosilactobacillus mucosae]MDC2848622.1 glutamate--cysteine ligase [Limosilactobacillus mucosae]MDC2852719.1 glutamate--cysteine ligase [Limosilactobacillus mucosae]